MVFSSVQIAGNVNFAGHMADLTVCRKDMVNIEVETGIHPLKIDVNLLFQHVRQNFHGALIQSAGIVVRNAGRIYRKGIKRVDIVGGIIAVTQGCLPAAGHGHGFGAGYRYCQIGHLAQRAEIMELPVTAQGVEVSAFAAVVLACRFLCVERYKISPRRLASDVQNGGIFMVIVGEHTGILSFYMLYVFP